MMTTQLRKPHCFAGYFVLILGFFLLLTAAAPTPRNILVLGDSITAGYGLEPAQAYPALIQNKIDAKRWPFKVINAGQSGDTTAGGLSRMDWLLRNHIDVLVVELGGNDGLRGLPAETTRKNLQAIIERSREKYPDVKIILAGMQVPPNMGRDYAKQFNAIFADIAKKNKAALVPFVLEGVGGVPALNLPDGIHPTAKGHEIVAANVWKVLEPILKPLATK
ncbi:MAG TPA: arylesterase [Candidatus Saccharimonadales bacterium]|nr:arylesterase [Candidatus Saccharimonadales bacterium]